MLRGDTQAVRFDQTNMLPQHILDRFARIPHDTPTDNDYYGVLNKILSSKLCFGEAAFTIEPRYPPDAGVNSVFTYVVKADDQPLPSNQIPSPYRWHFFQNQRRRADEGQILFPLRGHPDT